MLDLYEEFKAIIAALSDNAIDYAVCGGLAMSIHGFTRATVDIDLLIQAESFDLIQRVLSEKGYIIKGLPMTFANEQVEIRCISKIEAESGDLMRLDLLLVTPTLKKIWETREQIEWENGNLWVVSRDGLIELKLLRGSLQDLADIQRLNEETE